MKTFWKIVLGSLLGCILALGIIFFVLTSALGSLATSFVAEETATVPRQAILKIDFTTPISERGGEKFNFTMSGDMNVGNNLSLLDAVRAIDNAASDPSIRFIYMNVDKVQIEIAVAEELRDALKRFHDSGKAIVAYGSSLSNGSYYLASVADKVVLHAYGDAMITGLSSQVMYYKDLLDKLGIEVQLIRHGKYKSAGEPYIKNDISPENYEQNHAMLMSIWNGWCDAICESREFTPEEFNGWIDGLKLESAQSALDYGLVDELWYQDQLKEYLCTLFGVDNEKQLKFISLDKYAKATIRNNYKVKEKVAVIYADGEIVMDRDADGKVGVELADAIADVRQDSTVKAVVFRVNSPGGSVQASEVIRREIELLKQVKPVVASYGGYAASGGYWISSLCDKIFTDNTTLTGSIGCFSMVPYVGGAVKKNLKVNPVTISTNAHGGMMTGMNKLSAEETAYMQGMVEKIYGDFVGNVASDRNLAVSSVDSIAQGRVWTGEQALGIGLCDEIGGILDAISYAAAAAGLDQWQISERPAVPGMMEKLLGKLSNSGENIAELAEVLDSPLVALEKAYSPLRTSTEPLLMARMPYVYEIR